MSEDLVEKLTLHYTDWFAALTRPGTGPIDSLLADEWRYTNYDGLFRGKAEYLAWAAEAMDSLSFVGPYDVEVNQYGNVAICFGGYRVLHGSESDSLELRFSGVWIRKNDLWECVIHHNSRVVE